MRKLVFRYFAWMLLVGLAAWLVLGLALLANARPGQYTQSTNPEVGKWFHDQIMPGTTQRCCDISDGAFVEEDIRDGHYWVRWEKSKGRWIPVPDAVVINEPNKWGQAAVWWAGKDDGTDEIYVRCFVPGART